MYHRLRLSIQFCRQFAGRTLPSMGRSSRAEMNFKESNEPTSPYDVLDRNVHGIQERSLLNEIRKLNEQVKLDLPELQRLPYFNTSPDAQQKYSTEFSYKAITNFPGLTVVSEDKCDSAVHVKVSFDSLDLPVAAKEKLKTFFNLTTDAEAFEFAVSDFPFISQNKKRAMAVLEQLLQFSQDDKLSISDILGSDNSFEETRALKEKHSQSSKQKFPKEWLEDAQKINSKQAD